VIQEPCNAAGESSREILRRGRTDPGAARARGYGARPSERGARPTSPPPTVPTLHSLDREGPRPLTGVPRGPQKARSNGLPLGVSMTSNDAAPGEPAGAPLSDQPFEAVPAPL